MYLRCTFAINIGLLALGFSQTAVAETRVLSSSLLASSLTIAIPPAKPLPDWAKPIQAVPRKALVIGAGQYDHAMQLATPAHDADLVAGALRALNFDIQLRHLLKGRVERSALLAAVRTFADELNEGDVAFVYYSGHGLERDGVNYLVPSSGPAQTDSPGHDYVSLPYLLSVIDDRKVAAAVVILDACRADPFAGTDTDQRDVLDLSPPASTVSTVARTASISAPVTHPSGGLARVDTGPPAMLLTYAAQPDQPAFSLFRGDDPAVGSIFTRTIVRRLQTSGGYPVRDIVSLAETDVYAMTGQRQKPFQNPFGMLYLMLEPNPHLKAMEEELWSRTATTEPAAEQIKALKEFLRIYPASEHSAAARQELASLSTPEALALLQAAERATAMAPAISLSGALQSIATASDGSVLAGANRRITIRQSWGGILKGATVGSLQAGDVVKVVGVHPSGNAVRVLTNDGRFGYIGNLDVAAAMTPAPKALLSFAGSGPGEAPRDWSPVEQLITAKVLPTSSFRIAVAAETKSGISDQIGQLRALRLRDALIAKGIAGERISIEAADPSLPSQTAIITRLEARQ